MKKTTPKEPDEKDLLELLELAKLAEKQAREMCEGITAPQFCRFLKQFDRYYSIKLSSKNPINC